ncbi:MAG: SMC-Scp complex subunit ScpB [bacterium]
MSENVPTDIRHAVQVMLFSTTEPLSAYQMASLLNESGMVPNEETLTPNRVEKLIEQIVHDWEAEERPLTVLKIAGGFQMATRPEWADLVAKLQEDRRSQRLSRAALETLAIVAYKQPVIRPDVDAIRGVNSESALKTLMERDLVTIAGRDEGPGRPLLYKTTERFLKYFGLHSVDDLPDPGEIESMLGAQRPEPAEGRRDEDDEGIEETEGVPEEGEEEDREEP